MVEVVVLEVRPLKRGKRRKVFGWGSRCFDDLHAAGSSKRQNKSYLVIPIQYCLPTHDHPGFLGFK